FGEQTVLNPEGGFYELLSNYPAFAFIVGLATLTALLFYVTTADSAALVMANLSSNLRNPQEDGRAGLRIFWAMATGALTIAMLLVGGIGALQNATVIMGLPFAFVVILVMIGLYKALRVEANRVDSVDTSLPASLARRSRGRGNETWQRQLGRVLSFPNAARAREFEQDVLLPTLTEVAAEMEERGIRSRCGRVDAEGAFVDDGELIEFEVDGEGEFPFRYQVWPHKVSVPSFGGVVPRGTEDYYRMEVYLDGGTGQGYHIMGYSKEQIIDDVLDKYERHVEFLQLPENINHGEDLATQPADTRPAQPAEARSAQRVSTHPAQPAGMPPTQRVSTCRRVRATDRAVSPLVDGFSGLGVDRMSKANSPAAPAARVRGVDPACRATAQTSTRTRCRAASSRAASLAATVSEAVAAPGAAGAPSAEASVSTPVPVSAAVPGEVPP